MLEHIQGVPVFMADAQDPPIRTEQDALDLIIAAGHYGAGADWAAIPAGRFEAEFFELSTRIAGGIVQKFVSYQMGFAMIGDISRYTSGSESLAAFVRESNRDGTSGSCPMWTNWRHSSTGSRACGGTPGSAAGRRLNETLRCCCALGVTI